MELYIRHAEKQYNNGGRSKHSFDPNLTQQGRKETIAVAKSLLEDYGAPSTIVVSPFLRTRETGQIIVNTLRSFGHEVPITIEPRIGEFITVRHKKRFNPDKDLTQETLSYQPSYLETKEEFKDRVTRFLQESDYTSSNSNIWYVTHGYYISLVANYYGHNIARPDPLFSLAVKPEVAIKPEEVSHTV